MNRSRRSKQSPLMVKLLYSYLPSSVTTRATSYLFIMLHHVSPPFLFNVFAEAKLLSESRSSNLFSEMETSYQVEMLRHLNPQTRKYIYPPVIDDMVFFFLVCLFVSGEAFSRGYVRYSCQAASTC